MKYLKSKNFWIFLYIVCFILISFYISNILRTGTVDIISKPKEQPAIEVKPVKVTFVLEFNGQKSSYPMKSRNVDTVSELISQARKNYNFTYEKTAYIQGLVISSVNGYLAPNNFKWSVFENDVDITSNFDKVYLRDHTVYTLKLTEK